MRRLMNALLAFFLPALVCLTVRAVEELPSWAIKAYNEKLSARYELVKKTEPSFFAGDFNGDGRSDVALLIQERTTGKVGIAGLGLWEIRSALPNRIARTLFFVHEGEIVLLHG